MGATQPPPHEDFTGRLVKVAGVRWALLLIGQGRSALRGGLIHQGHVAVYYAFPLLYSTDFVFPCLVFDEFRREHRGPAAIDFILNKGNSYPRADVTGIRLSDGQKLDLFMKEVDVGAGICAFAYPAQLEGSPLARLEAAIWLDDAVASLERLTAPGESDDVLLSIAVRRYRCSPASLPTLYEKLRAADGA